MEYSYNKNSMEDNHSIYKITTIGDSGVGKSSIMMRIVKNRFDSNSLSTIGASYMNRIIQINNKVINLQLWDTAGQEKYNSIIPMYLRNASCVLLVFDINQINTLENIKTRWIPLIKQTNLENGEYKCVFYIIANKFDMKNLSSEDEEKTKEILNDIIDDESLSIKYFNISAKSGYNIDKLFKKLIEDLENCKLDIEIKEDKSNISLSNTNENNSKSCCKYL